VIAILVVVFGLMIDLASEVRRRSAEQLTAGMLAKLDAAMSHYLATHPAPAVHPLIDDANLPAPAGPVEERLHRSARANNVDFLRFLRGDGDLTASTFADLPASLYDERTVRDAWGNPIVYMPYLHPEIGMAPDDRPFFFSPGPDGLYLTRVDNLYSYEVVGKEQ